VKDQGKEIKDLNEREWIHGEIFANVWHENRIARISGSGRGRVTRLTATVTIRLTENAKIAVQKFCAMSLG
jgi:glutamine cyclotransferase